MKLILAVVRDRDNEPVSQALVSDGFRVTRIASTGGFLRRGSSTLMVGVDDDKLDEAISIIKNNLDPATEPGIKRLTIFVLNITDYQQI